MQAEKLAADWLTAKRQEQEAIARRIAIENELLKIHPAKEEGSSTMTLSNGIKFRATGRLTYKVDLDRLLVLTSSWPEKPIKTKIEADESMLRTIRAEKPDQWKLIAGAVTVKPGKTYVVIEEQQHEL